MSRKPSIHFYLTSVSTANIIISLSAAVHRWKCNSCKVSRWMHGMTRDFRSSSIITVPRAVASILSKPCRSPIVGGRFGISHHIIELDVVLYCTPRRASKWRQFIYRRRPFATIINVMTNVTKRERSSRASKGLGQHRCWRPTLETMRFNLGIQ